MHVGRHAGRQASRQTDRQALNEMDQTCKWEFIMHLSHMLYIDELFMQ